GLAEKVGSLKAGLVADMAAFGGDPARNIRDMDRAETVVQSGRLLKLGGAVLV
ncbi:MAG: amidohydrolase family protein, partial [Chloroflexi bacterium]|nr:amidohydrolase family protein [Chloroflexota bacterium]